MQIDRNDVRTLEVTVIGDRAWVTINSLCALRSQNTGAILVTINNKIALDFNQKREEPSPVCGWQGFGGGAAYEDVGCAEGQLVDLDACDTPGGPCDLIDEVCPQCYGKGKLEDGDVLMGPHALMRRRSLGHAMDQINLLMSDHTGDSTHDEGCRDSIEELQQSIEGAAAIITKLESPGVFGKKT